MNTLAHTVTCADTAASLFPVNGTPGSNRYNQWEEHYYAGCVEYAVQDTSFSSDTRDRHSQDS